MSEDLDHHTALDNLHAYVLGALEAEEMLAMDDYIEQQRRLLAELERAEEAAMLLAHSAPPAPLPQQAKQRLMARVQADLDAQVPLASSLTSPAGAERPPAARQTTTARPARRGWTGSPGFWRGAAGLAAAAVLLLLVYTSQTRQALGVTRAQLDVVQGDIARLEQANQRLEEEVSQLAQSNEALEESNRVLQQQAAGLEDRLAVVATAQRATLLPGTEEAPTARGAFYQSGDQGLLVWQGLEPLAAEQTYQLWLIPADGAPVPAGLLAVQDAGTSSLAITLPAGAEEYAAVGVSIEPGGGSLAPTGPIVLLGATAAPEGES